MIEQFERAKRECSTDPSRLGAWLPILQQYGPALIEQCESAEALARQLVRQWLRAYMFAGQANAVQKATQVARWFASYSIHRSHALGIDRDQARDRGVVIHDLEGNNQLQDAVLSVHHATMHTFAGAAIKIVENHLGRAWVQSAQMFQIQPGVQLPQVTPPSAPAPPPAAPPTTPSPSP